MSDETKKIVGMHTSTRPSIQSLEAALREAEIPYSTREDDESQLADFVLGNEIAIDLAPSYSKWAAVVLDRHPNCILVQGDEATRWFTELVGCGDKPSGDQRSTNLHVVFVMAIMAILAGFYLAAAYFGA